MELLKKMLPKITCYLIVTTRRGNFYVQGLEYKKIHACPNGIKIIHNINIKITNIFKLKKVKSNTLLVFARIEEEARGHEKSIMEAGHGAWGCA